MEKEDKTNDYDDPCVFDMDVSVKKENSNDLVLLDQAPPEFRMDCDATHNENKSNESG